MNTIGNWGAAVWNSLVGVLAAVFAFIPKLVGFLVILLIGFIIAKALEKAVVWLCHRANVDAASERAGLVNLERRLNTDINVARLLGRVAFWFVFLIFLVPASDSLGLPTISNLLSTIVAYIPNVFVAILALFLGTLLATFVGDLVLGATASSGVGNPRVFSTITRVAIIALATLLALYQLQIAPAILQTLFAAIVGALALAFGLAFGLGGRESAQQLLQRTEGRFGRPTTAQEPMQPPTGAYGPEGRPGMAPGGMTGGTSGMSPAQAAAAKQADEQLQRRSFSQQPYRDQPPR
ncbi:mechanosensitive ion channel family protein [Ktedonobacter racemifer]|uniref:Conserved TM helix repeat-containing protein n=1 Tax=Ktedonobacter racemifer DSM 44963 TaxID=485913 RepID=D6TDU5_KTERA|nr:Conserved TM helix repeat-containing protein [Ktedonobacter racemifer]EFH90227.1 Conserved TM helix repeat-containing protein [Ktedonobacter racemifer DSM 44963]